MKYDWILFDLDNTLMDFSNASHKAFHRLLESHGIRHAEELYPVYKQVNFEIWKDFEKGKIDASTLKAKRFHDFFMKIGVKGIDSKESNDTYVNHVIEYSTMLEGSLELLESLKGRVKLAIITNGLKEAQRPRIKRLNIDHYFDVIVVSDEIGVAKPQKGFFDFVMNECGFPEKQKTLVVGDSLNSDIKGGLDYGLPTCWCNLFGQENKGGLKPDFEINHLSQLHSFIEE